jgi:hypothetical protein
LTIASNPPGDPADPKNLGTIFALIGQIPIDVIDYPKPEPHPQLIVPQNPLEPVNKLFGVFMDRDPDPTTP